ncbi:MAG: hypothetical protein LBR69_04510 [Endomicrobium sp.]|jgi:hypothetical protein|nr:hypothetical protein [Endomicrobium sp.]
MRKLQLLLFLVFFCFSAAYANLKIDPQRIASTVTPDGAPIKGSYSVTNNYDGDVTLEVNAELNKDWSYRGNFDIPIASWLKITPSKLSIRKGETKLVLYTIFPNNSIKGSVVGQVKFKVHPPSSPGVNVLMSLPVHIIMQGTENIEYGIDSLDIISLSNGVKRLNIAIRNDSNILVRPAGMVDIYSGKKKVRSVQLFESVSAYPGTVSKDFSVDMPSDLKPGKYRADVSIKLIGYDYFIKPVVRSMQFRVLKDGSIIS